MPENLPQIQRRVWLGGSVAGHPARYFCWIYGQLTRVASAWNHFLLVHDNMADLVQIADGR